MSGSTECTVREILLYVRVEEEAVWLVTYPTW